MRILLGLSCALILASCSSRSFKKDYQVVDASHQEIPEWTTEPKEWAKDEDENDYKKYRYYVFSTEPKNSRTMACELAKARAGSEIASEIGQFIKQSLASATHGDPTQMDQKLSEYVEESLAKEVQTSIVGAKVHRTYWEKRKIKKDLDAKKDSEGYVCSALIKISKDNLDIAFNRANQSLSQKADSSEAKAKVAKAIEEAQEAFKER